MNVEIRKQALQVYIDAEMDRINQIPDPLSRSSEMMHFVLHLNNHRIDVSVKGLQVLDGLQKYYHANLTDGATKRFKQAAQQNKSFSDETIDVYKLIAEQSIVISALVEKIQGEFNAEQDGREFRVN